MLFIEIYFVFRMIHFIYTNAFQRVKRAVKRHTTGYANQTFEPCKLISPVKFFKPKMKNAELTNGSNHSKNLALKICGKHLSYNLNY